MGEGEKGTGAVLVTYSIEISSKARRSLKKIDKSSLAGIFGALELLRNNPRPPLSRQLKGSPYFRVRVGGYRIIYLIKKSALVILVIDVGLRKEIYRSNP